MSNRSIYLIGVSVGSLVGGYVPELFHAGAFSFWGVLTGAAGGMVGLWLAYRFVNN